MVDTTLQDPLVGQLLDGRYQVESRIARGGMATVYRALDVRLDRHVALKVMHQIYADDDEFVARFIREAKSAARLSHPNVVSVFDQGEDAGHVFLAMEYVQGRTLRDLLRERHTLRPQEALSILAPVLAALSAAHAAGLVHRDVKPENVLLADDGRVKVADFGLARAAATHTTTSATTLIGTVAYLAPEQVTRGVADARSDVYAAGIMLFEMLTGRPPYDGETPISVAYRHAHESVPAPSTAVDGIPASVDALVEHATARDPDRRPVDAGAFLAEAARVRRSLPALEADTTSATTLTPRSHQTLVVDLPGAGIGRGQAATDAPPPDEIDDEYARKRRRRRRRGLIALLLVLLLAAGAASAGWWYGVGRYTKAPTLTGISVADAQRQASKAHVQLKVDPNKQWSATVQSGDIIDQSIKPGHRVLRGETITVVVSKGKHTATIPAVDSGISAADYEAKLKSLGFQVAPDQPAFSETVPEGGVISVDPEAGQVVDYGKTVTVTVSKGLPPIGITNYQGQDADQAAKALTDAGFKVVTTSDYSDTVKAGQVISQNPSSGTGHKGDTITLDVSKGPQLFKVPDVTSKLNDPSTWVSADQAKTILQNAGFTNVKTIGKDRFHIVTHQDPKAGSMKPKDTLITLTVD
jgi:serine/threonine-protein kinase